ncbi:guanylate kinase [candidate division TA06 bacterium]|nr:guanylate kinase [candidate division TA06 bacterium]
MIYPDRKGFPIILSAPSGAGKTTLCRGVEALHPEIYYSISVTSRPPRAGERDGQDYHFVPVKEFEQMLEAGQLLEWAMVHENYYGTPRKQIDDKLNAGQDVIMDIDTVGARAIKKLYPQAVTIFVLPPTFEELKTRLKGRATDSEEVINKRLNRAKLEMQEIGDFEYWLINDKFEQTVKTVTAIIEAERCKLIRYNRDEVVNVIK